MTAVLRRRSTRTLVLTLTLLLAQGWACSKAPANLTPEGKLDWTRLQVIKTLDLLRNTAIEGHALTPPLFTEQTTGAVVSYHRSAIQIVHQTGTGWRATLVLGLDELVRNLPPAEGQRLAPYVLLIRTILAEVAP